MKPNFPSYPLARAVVRGSGGGGKGGGGGGSAPSEAPDSLRSKQYAHIIDLLSEGEIHGLIDGLKSIYLDDTPIQNADGSYNFTGVSVDSRNGTQAQTYIPGFSSVEAETVVGVEIKELAPVIRSIVNPNINAVRVTISIPQLTYQDPTNGSLSGTEVAIAIDLQNNGGGYVEPVLDIINGKTTSRYQRSYRIELPAPGPWDIKLRRSDDADSVTQQNRTFWDSYTEIIDAKLTYPNSALVAMSVDSEGFAAIPRRGFEIKGLLVRIPSNYDPIERTYTGIWDGTFTYSWTNNPAWCFYDIIIEKRYGLGKYVNADQVDKWGLYKIAQYCDQLVPDGFGGFEPRYTCNLYLQTPEEAFRVLTAMASIFCGFAYWANGVVVPSADMPSDPVALFTPANVVGGSFNYSGSSVKARHTVALVSWNDPSDRYRQKIEYVADQEGIKLYGVKQTEIVAIGCTSRGQAHRAGRSILYTERMETETVVFRAGMDGLAIAPGEVIKTSDPIRTNVRLGGRLKTAIVSQVVLDQAVEIVGGRIYTLWAVMPDGTVESRTVTTPASVTDTLDVAPDFSDTPLELSIWTLGVSNLADELWRVISIAEVDDTQAEIAALKYTPGKYDEIEKDILLEPLPIGEFQLVPPPPSDLNIVESLYPITPLIIGTRMTVSWLGTTPYYELLYRRVGQNWSTYTGSTTSVDIQPVEPGDYEFQLVGLNSLRRRSTPVNATKTIYGLSALPQDVTGFALSAIAGFAHITVNPAPDLDVIVGGYLRIKHTSLLVDAVWSNAIDIGPQLPGTSTYGNLPLVSGTYMAKWVDSSGGESANAVSIITDAPNVMNMNFIEDLAQDPDFDGTKVNVFTEEGLGLILDSELTIDEMLDLVDDWPRISAIGGLSNFGIYYFAESIDLGAVQTSRLTARLIAAGFDALDTIDERPEVDTWPSVDGEVINDVNCQLFVRTTHDNPVGSPVWTAWAPFIVGDYIARAFEFKAELSSSYSTHNIAVSELAVVIDMPDRIESVEDLVSGTGVYQITYSLPFMREPAVGITAQNMQTGDFYTITDKLKTGCKIQFKNNLSAGISRTFDYTARSY